MERKLISARIDPAVWKAARLMAISSGKELWRFLEDTLRDAIPESVRGAEETKTFENARRKRS